MFDTDKELERLGFVKDFENSLMVSYSRFDKMCDYVQVVDIVCKQSGNHTITSYAKSDYTFGSPVVGLTHKETKLFEKKFRQMKRKYKWG